MRLFVWGAAIALLTTSAAAEDVAGFYRGKTLRIIVGFSAGGGADLYARVLARHIGKHIPGNPTVIVQNMPGAASLNAVKYLGAAAPTDGTTVVAFNSGLITQSLTAPKKIGASFLDFAWLGNVTEDFRFCHTWNGTGIKSWEDLLARPQVIVGNTGIGTAAYTDARMLGDLFGVKVKQVMGYPGSTEKRIAIERGEIDADCTSWTAIPEQWVHEKKITFHSRFSKRLLPGMPEKVHFGRDLLTDETKRQAYDVLTAASLIGRPYIAPKSVPADRLAALQTAFDDTMKDPEYLAESKHLGHTVTPMTGGQVEDFLKTLYQTPGSAIAAAKAISGD
jgi:tripartite-type tricarboxylate transporter receptor subunit TctC